MVLSEILSLAATLHIAEWANGHLPMLRGGLINCSREGYLRCFVVIKKKYQSCVVDYLHTQGLCDIVYHKPKGKVDDEYGANRNVVCKCTLGCPLFRLGVTWSNPPASNKKNHCGCRGQQEHFLQNDEVGVMVRWSGDKTRGKNISANETLEKDDVHIFF
jgi:hypothetical protein